MIAYLRGKIAKKSSTYVIVETAGIGYQVFVSPSTLAKLPEGLDGQEEVRIFTYMNVKEDGISLYGFSSMEEQEMFLRLLSVSGVGPKGALGFLSQLSPQEIVMAILTDDIKTLSKSPGVGRKTAQRVVLELKDKCSTQDAVAIPTQGGVTIEGAKFEAMEAMEALGYSRAEAAKAVNAVAAKDMDASAIISAALRKMVTF